MAKYTNKFREKEVKLMGLSSDELSSHNEWIKDVEAYAVRICMHACKVSIYIVQAISSDKLIAYACRMEFRSHTRSLLTPIGRS